MFSPEEQQVEICLLKSSLSGIENDLVVQRNALPALDAENEQQYRETMNVLRVARSLNAELDKLKQDNVRLVAKRLQLKKQCENMAQSLENTRHSRNDIIDSLYAIEKEDEQTIRKYEDSLREKADRFRKARIFYNEEEMVAEIKKIEEENSSLENEVSTRQANVDGLCQQLAQLSAHVPQDILEIIGKNDLEDILQTVTNKCASLEEKLNK